MSDGLDAATRFPSSRLRRSPDPRADARLRAMSCRVRSTRHAKPSGSSPAQRSSAMPIRVPRSTRPSSAPGNLSHLMRTGSPAQTSLVMTTLIPRIPIPPRCSRFLLEARNRANAPSGTAIRSARRSLPGIQRTPRSPAAVLVYLYPDGERADEPALQSRLSSTAGKPDVRPHTRRPPLPRPAHASCGAASAPVPPSECRRGRRHLDATLLQCGLRNR